MTTEVMTKEVFIEFIKEAMGKEDVIIFSNVLDNIKVLSKKKINYGKSYNIIYPNDVFEKKDTITDLLNCITLGIIICDNKHLNKKLREQFKEIKNETKD